MSRVVRVCASARSGPAWASNAAKLASAASNMFLRLELSILRLQGRTAFHSFSPWGRRWDEGAPAVRYGIIVTPSPHPCMGLLLSSGDLATSFSLPLARSFECVCRGVGADRQP